MSKKKKDIANKNATTEISFRRFFFLTLAAMLFILPVFHLPASLPIYAPLVKASLFKLFMAVLTGLFLVEQFTSSQREAASLERSGSRAVYLLLGLSAVCALISSASSKDIHQALFGSYIEQEGFFVVLLYVWLVAMLTVLRPRRDELRISLNALLAGAGAVSVLVIFQYVFQVGIFYEGFTSGLSDRPRPTATLGNPVFLASYLVMVLPIALGRFFVDGPLEDKGVPAILIWLVSFSLLATFTRGAWIAALASLLIFLTLLGARALREMRPELLVSSLAVVLAILSILPFFSSSAVSEDAGKAVSERLEGGSAGSRLIMWDGAIKMAESSALNGYGPENTGFSLPFFVSPKLYESEGFGVATRIHNDILQRTLDGGFLYSLLFLWLLIWAYLASWRKISLARERQISDTTKSSVSVISLRASLVAASFAYVAAIQTSFMVVAVAPIFWVLVGFLFGTTGNDRPGPGGKAHAGLSRALVLSIAAAMLLLSSTLSVLGAKQVLADKLDSEANFAFQEGRFDEGIEQVRAAERTYSAEPHYKFALASAYYNLVQLEGYPDKLGALHNAEDLLLQLTSARPHDQLAVTNLGNVYFALGSLENEERYRDAAEQYQKATKLNPIYYRNYFFLGDTYKAMGEIKRAKQNYERALELSPGQEDVTKALQALEAQVAPEPPETPEK